LDEESFLSDALIDREKWDIDAVYIPETEIDINAEIDRLENCMNEKDSVNIFLSEGAGLDSVLVEMEKQGEMINRDAFGHVRLDEINPGQWFAKQFSKKIGAEKTLVQKSGYFARSAKPNKRDLELIQNSAGLAAEVALDQRSGVIGRDMNNDNKLGLIDFNRIKGGRPFDYDTEWYKNMLNAIGQ
jgi:pyrophosphate--fructose-6-phosphate 1-phosphotransferase